MSRLQNRSKLQNMHTSLTIRKRKNRPTAKDFFTQSSDEDSKGGNAMHDEPALKKSLHTKILSDDSFSQTEDSGTDLFSSDSSTSNDDMDISFSEEESLTEIQKLLSDELCTDENDINRKIFFEWDEKMSFEKDIDNSSINSLSSYSSLSDLHSMLDLGSEFSDSSSQSDCDQIFLNEDDFVEHNEGIAEVPGLSTTDNLDNHMSLTSTQEKIGTFNVKNQFTHEMAGEIFMKGGFSILCFQEPFAAHSEPNKSWESIMRRELQGGRITPFFSKHQIILADLNKWGGKFAETFVSHDKGRAISFVLHAGGKMKWGFISIYAPTIDGRKEIPSDDPKSKWHQRGLLRKFVRNTINSWKRKYNGNVNIIILGDLQETVSKTDRDNFGKKRGDG